MKGDSDETYKKNEPESTAHYGVYAAIDHGAQPAAPSRSCEIYDGILREM